MQIEPPIKTHLINAQQHTLKECPLWVISGHSSVSGTTPDAAGPRRRHSNSGPGRRKSWPVGEPGSHSLFRFRRNPVLPQGPIFCWIGAERGGPDPWPVLRPRPWRAGGDSVSTAKVMDMALPASGGVGARARPARMGRSFLPPMSSLPAPSGRRPCPCQ
jgi:hypothetical protein